MIPFKNITDPDIFNYNINSFIKDANNTLSKLNATYELLQNNIDIYNSNLLEILLYNINTLHNKVLALKTIIERKGIKNFLLYDFNSVSDKSNDYILYKDPKTNANMTNVALHLAIDENDGALIASNIPSIKRAPHSIYIFSSLSEIPYSYAISENTIKGIFISTSEAGYDIELILLTYPLNNLNMLYTFTFDNLLTINAIELNNKMISPFDITDIEFFDIDTKNWQTISYKQYNLINKHTLLLPNITAPAIKLKIRIKNPIYTNNIGNLNLSTLSQYLLNNFTNILNSYSASLSDYYKIYPLHIEDLNIASYKLTNDKIFLTQPFNLNNSKRLSIETNEITENATTEYYLIIDNNIARDIIPILPTNKTTNIEEVLRPVEPEIFNLPNTYTINNTTHTIYKVAKLQFAPQNNISIYVNDTLLQQNNYFIKDNTVYFLVDIVAQTATAKYTPKFANQDHITPVFNTDENLNFEQTINFSNDAIVFLNENFQESSTGFPYLKAILNYIPDLNENITIKKLSYVNGNLNELNQAPEFFVSYEQNPSMLNNPSITFIFGRIIYIPMRLDLYPWLINCKFLVSGKTQSFSFNNNIDYYYSPEGELLINKTLRSNSKAYIMIIARNSGINSNATISNVIVYSDKPIAKIGNLLSTDQPLYEF